MWRLKPKIVLDRRWDSCWCLSLGPQLSQLLSKTIFGFWLNIWNSYCYLDTHLDWGGEHTTIGWKTKIHYCRLFFCCNVCDPTWCSFDDYARDTDVAFIWGWSLFWKTDWKKTSGWSLSSPIENNEQAKLPAFFMAKCATDHFMFLTYKLHHAVILTLYLVCNFLKTTKQRR